MSGGGVLTGVALVAATAGLAAAGAVLPVRAPQPLPAAAVPVPEPARSMVCPGPPVLTGSAEDSAVAAVAGGAPSATDPQFTASKAATASSTWVLAPKASTSAVSVTALPGRAADGVEPTAVQLAGQARATRVVDAGPLGIVARPSADAPATAGALTVAATASGDLRGLSASSCAVATSDTWLVGGATEVGHGARLVVGNPGATPATVDVEVFTSTGPLAPAAGSDLVVQPGERREVLLEALAPGEKAIAVHVQAAGGRVAAFVVDTALRGLVPAGVDVVAPGAPPSTRQVVPAVVADDATSSTLRLVAGSLEAVVSWRLLGPDGPLPGDQAVVTVPAGSVVDVALPSLDPGVYTAVVESETPVVAAVQSLRGTPTGGEPRQASGAPRSPDLDRPTDVAWSPSATPLDGQGAAEAVVALPTGGGDAGEPVATLTLAAVEPAASSSAAQDASVVLRPVLADGVIGAPHHVEVDAGTTVRLTGSDLAPEGASGVLLAGSGADVVAGLLLEHDDQLATVAVLASPAAQPPVFVRQAPEGAWP